MASAKINRLDLVKGKLVQTPGGEILRISAVRTTHSGLEATVSVVFPVPPKTTIRHCPQTEIDQWREPTPEIFAAYERAWGR